MTMVDTEPDFDTLVSELRNSYDGMTQKERAELEKRQASKQRVAPAAGAAVLTEREAHDFFAKEWNTPFGD